MKILYVDYYYEYGKKERGLNYIGINGFQKALESLGHEVVCFYHDAYIHDTKALNESLLNFFNIEMPSLVFCNLYNTLVSVDTIKEMTKKSITVNWFGDDPFLFERFTKTYANMFSICITTDKFSIRKYHEIDQNNVIYSQWPAFETKNVDLDAKNYKYDVSFIGAKNPPREWFVSRLIEEGINVATFGNGWANGPVTNDEMLNIFAESKINLNLSNSDIWDIQFLFSKYVSKKMLLKKLLMYILQKNRFTRKISGTNITLYGKYASQIKARNFEIPMSGGFQLTNYVPTLEDYFVIGKEVACFNSVDEAVKQINYFLDEESQREQIKREAYNKSITEFTYKIALSKVFTQINFILNKINV